MAANLPLPPGRSGSAESLTRLTPTVLIDVALGELTDVVLGACRSARTAVLDVEAQLSSRSDRLLRDAAILILGARSVSGRPSTSLIERARFRFPRLSIYVCVNVCHRVDLVRFSRSGAGMVFTPGTESDVESLRATVRARIRAPAPTEIIWSLAERLPSGETRNLAIDCLLESFRPRSVGEMELRFGRNRKTLSRRLAREGVISVGYLLRGGRLGHASELTESGSWTRESVARQLGFGSAKALAESWRRARRTGLARDNRVWVWLE